MEKKQIKHLVTDATIRRGHIGFLVKYLIKEGRAVEILANLISKGVTLSVAQEWANEPLRRASLTAKNSRRTLRKETSAFGRRGVYGRRIVWSELVKGDPELRPTMLGWDRTFEYHATKGQRGYRAQAS